MMISEEDNKICTNQRVKEENFQKSFALCTSTPLPLDRAMAAHSSTLAWKIPWTEEPGRLWCPTYLGQRQRSLPCGMRVPPDNDYLLSQI